MSKRKKGFPYNLLALIPPVGRFSERPAQWVDDIYISDPKSTSGKVKNFVFSRLVANVLFPLFAAVDVVSSLVLASANFIGFLFTADKTQKYFLNNMQEYASLFSKNILALLATVLTIGLWSPKLTTLTFIPDKDKNGTVSSTGKLYKDKVERLVPNTEAELIAEIQKAGREEYCLSVVGAGRSQGKQYMPAVKKTEDGQTHVGKVIDLSCFKTVKIDTQSETATVGAGATWADIQMLADKYGLALKVMQASNVFTVGGSLGTDIHGWDHKTGVLANTILSLTYIAADGLKHKIERKEGSGFIHTIYDPSDANGERVQSREELADDPAFHHIIGGFGQFGVVTEVKLKLTKNEKLHEVGVKVAPSAYVEHFHEEVETNPKVAMHLYRLSLDPKHMFEEGVSVDYQRWADCQQVQTEDLQQEGVKGSRFSRVLANFARHFGFLRRWYWQGERDRLLDPKTHQIPLTTNEIMQPEINAMFNEADSEAEWLQEFFLPGEQLGDFLKALAKILMDNNVALLNGTVRFVKKHDKNPLSYALDGDKFAVVLCFNQSLLEADVRKARKWIREAQALTTRMQGTFYLPYQQVASPAIFDKSYPQAEAFRRYKKEVDPQGIFTSGLYQQYIAPKPDEHNHYRAIFDNPDLEKRARLRKAFRGFINNVFMQVDCDKLYDLIDDILKYCDSNAEIYRELKKRVPEEIGYGAITKIRQILKSLDTIKHDLTAQAVASLPPGLKYNGLVEIGYPGRFVKSFKEQLDITGTITAVHEAQSITDHIQVGAIRPNDKFVPLDYSAPKLQSIDRKSADIVTCFVGLHHFTPKALDSFLKQVRGILRDGGHFLLVDHDARSQDEVDMAAMAHSIFNAVTGVSEEDEASEVRHFKPMSEWVQILAKYGLEVDMVGPDIEQIRKGDPSRNRMLSFKKGPLPQKDEIVVRTKRRGLQLFTTSQLDAFKRPVVDASGEFTDVQGESRDKKKKSPPVSALPFFAQTGILVQPLTETSIELSPRT